MRTISTEMQNLLNKNSRHVFIKVEIEDADGNMQDMSDFKGHDWIISVDFGDNVDADGMDASIVFARDIGFDSTAPLNKTTRVNLDSGGGWNPLLFLGRQVLIYTKYASEETAETTAWNKLFKGNIDVIDWGTYEVTVTCRDQIRELQDTFIETEVEYSIAAGSAVEGVIQDILNDNLTVAPTLWTPTSPAWNVTNFYSQKQSILDQITMLADQLGWRIKYTWDEGTTAFRLTFFEPDRDKVAVDYTFTEDDYYSISSLSVDIKNVRNAVTVKYPDPTDLATDGSPIYHTVTRINSDSINLYGRRWIGITEAATSIIDTSAEAQRMADAILADLRTPKNTKQVEMPFFLPVELEDLYTFTANNVHYTDDITMAVTGYRHTFTNNTARTVLILREDTPIGKSLTWFDLAAENGISRNQFDRTLSVLDSDVTSVNGSAVIQFELNEPIIDKAPHNPTIPADLWFEVFVTPTGGTPNVATDLYMRTTSTSVIISPTDDGKVPVDTDLDVHIRAVTANGEGSFLTVPINIKPYGSASIDRHSIMWMDGVQFNFNEQTKGTDYPPDLWEMTTGTWNTEAELDDGTTYASVTTQYGSAFLLFK